MFYRFALLISSFLLVSLVSAQDTTSVYFRTGSHKISTHSQKTLEKVFANLDYTELIEIKFIGYSDSTGNSESNQKLSERRAKAVFKSVKGHLNIAISVVTESKGELPRKVDSLSRRVDVIFRYSELSDLDETDTLTIQPDDPRCFFIDQYIEGYSNVKVKVNKRKKVIYLQVLNYPEFSSRKYYYVKNPSQPNAIAQRVKFKLETTGSLWWREKRLTATIPKDSYDKFGLFYLEKPPCDGCREQLFKQDTNVFIGTSIEHDLFMMSVTQLKAKLFRPRLLQIRIPKEYMEENKSLYAIKTLEEGGTVKKEELNWKSKRGKRKADYLYTNIRTKGVRSFTIGSLQRVSVCPRQDGGGYYNRWLGCGNRITRGSSPGEFSLIPAIHAFYHNDTITALVSVGLKYNRNQHEFEATIGINHRLGFYYSAHYHFEILSFDLVRNGWHSMEANQPTKRLAIYSGPEFRSSYNKGYRSFSELNLHVGLSVDWSKGLGCYLQGGVARDLSNRINTGFYPYIQVGIRFRFKI